MRTQTRLTDILTDDTWDRRRRNSAARQMALARSAGDDALIRSTYAISQDGVVGRYDRLRAKLMEVIAEACGCAVHTRSLAYNYQGRRIRYESVLFGYESDTRQTVRLYEGLLNTILDQVTKIDGDNVAARRRQRFNLLLDRISSRLAEVDSTPSMSWVSDHQYVASEALDNSPIRWHAEAT